MYPALIGKFAYYIYGINLKYKAPLHLDIPEPLTTPFRNIKNIIPKYFDHPNALIHRINIVLKLTQLTKCGARNRVVKRYGTSNTS
jgi:hypothetical protein